MKKLTLPITALLFVLFGYAKPVVAQKGQDVASIIYQKDSLFWEAYNNCNLPGMAQYFTDDVEFYHDKGGVTFGLPALNESVKKGLCGTPGYKLRRAAVAGTVKVFPMENGGAVYAAIISGQHYFYVTEGGKPEYLDGLARFAQLWVLQNGEWKMSRVLSYDHGPANRPTDAR